MNIVEFIHLAIISPSLPSSAHSLPLTLHCCIKWFTTYMNTSSLAFKLVLEIIFRSSIVMSPSDLAEEFSILYIYSPERMSDRPIFNEITYSYDDYEGAYALRNFFDPGPRGMVTFSPPLQHYSSDTQRRTWRRSAIYFQHCKLLFCTGPLLEILNNLYSRQNEQ